MIIVKCNRCKRELSTLDDANILKYNNRSVFSITTMHETDNQLLDGGDTVIICKTCMEEFENYLSDKTEKIKVYFYDDKGNELFTRIYVVDSIAHIIDYVNQTVLNNDGAFTYFIEKVE